MDELALLRKTRSEGEPPKAALNRGRAALLERTAGTAAQRPTRRTSVRRRFAIGGLGSLGAAALVAGLVLADVAGLAGWRGGADPAAAAVLQEASKAAIKTVDPVLEPGQYLKVRTRGVHLAGVGGDDVTYYQSLTDDTLYRPADLDDDWVWVRGPQSVYATFGPESKKVADRWSQEAASPDSFESGDLLRAEAGTFYQGEKYAGLDDLDGLPRDPQRLLDYIYRVTADADTSPETEAFVYIADRLRIGTVPADLRAAMYEAAALIPGVEFVDKRATLDGRTGVAIGRVEDSRGTRVEIIIDPATGEFIGDREVLIRDQDGIPAGTAQSWTSVTTSVVDSAPKGGTVCGKMATDPATGKCSG